MSQVYHCLNEHLGRLKRLFKWAKARHLIPARVWWEEVAIVEPLECGRTAAPERDPILPVAADVVEATLPHLSPVVADMVRLQRLMAARPQEVCYLRPRDVDRSKPVWVYRPHRHKLQHKRKDRLIHVGPAAQEILLPYLLREAGAYCFSPAEALAQIQAERRERRKTRVQPSQISRKKARPKRQPGTRYTTAAYGLAIRRAADRADAQAHREQPDVSAKMRLVPTWAPNQLRHAAAEAIKAEFSIEAAAAALGHSRLETTQRYAKLDYQKAAAVAAKIG